MKLRSFNLANELTMASPTPGKKFHPKRVWSGSRDRFLNFKRATITRRQMRADKSAHHPRSSRRTGGSLEHRLLALSFVPPEDVADCFDQLNDNRPDELAPVYDYWEDNYIGRLRRKRRSAPTFPIALWNMRSRVADGLPRTNNLVESWHHAFQSSVTCHHPNIYKLIEHIQAERDHTEQLTARFNAGNQTSSKNKYIQVTRRLTALLPTYGTKSLLEFVRDVAHNTQL